MKKEGVVVGCGKKILIACSKMQMSWKGMPPKVVNLRDVRRPRRGCMLFVTATGFGCVISLDNEL